MQTNTTTINIKTLTPVHIGSGEALQSNYDYLLFSKEKCLAVIDPRRILDIIGVENINHWVEAIDNRKNLLDALPMLKNCKAADIAARIIHIGNSPKENSDIKAQIHLGNQQPTIPGSSLKGAIRTALLTKLITDNPDFVQTTEHLGSKKGSFMDFNDRQITANYLGQEGKNRFGELQGSPKKDLLRFLRVGDIYFEQKTEVVKNTVINLYRHGWGEKTEESSYYECLPKGQTAKGTLQIPEDTIKMVKDKNYIDNPQNLELLRPQCLLKIINEHTKTLIEREIGFWEDRDNPLAVGDYVEHLERLENIAKKCGEGEAVIRVGANVGWEFMTGGWASGTDKFGDFILEDKDWQNLKKDIWRKFRKSYAENMTFPKTRKMIAGGEPMGFLKLEMVR